LDRLDDIPATCHRRAASPAAGAARRCTCRPAGPGASTSRRRSCDRERFRCSP